MNDKEVLKEFKDSVRYMKAEAWKLIHELNEVDPVEGLEYLKFESIDDFDLNFTHEMSIPINCAFIQEDREEFIRMRKERRDLRKKKETKAREELKQTAVEKRREQYEVLKKEFGGNND